MTLKLSVFQWKKTSSTLWLIKEDLGHKTSGVYCVPCECGKVYAGQTSRTIEIRCQEHIRHLHHGQTAKSAVAEHVPNTIWNAIGENTQTVQDDYVHGVDYERSNRNSTACQKLKDGIQLHVKLYMAASNQFTEMLSTTSNREPRPSAVTLWLLPLTRGVAFHPATSQMERSAELDT